MSLFKDPDTTFGRVPSISIQVCWNCEYVQGLTGRYSSRGPKCAECGEYLETYKILED